MSANAIDYGGGMATKRQIRAELAEITRQLAAIEPDSTPIIRWLLTARYAALVADLPTAV